jgi:hypothetical protein
MEKKMIYLYLARRDKKEVKILATFNGDKIHRTLIQDVTDLNLPDVYAGDIKQVFEEHKMLWEVWIESADSFQNLTNVLVKRGYQKMPRPSPMLKIKPATIVKSAQERIAIVPRIKVSPRNIMIQRSSSASN